ncbi:MAG: hypothetical protein ABEJ75_00510 [Candidatus Nanohaloarchaea archaeon]
MKLYESEGRDRDVFGLPKLTLNAEIGTSFTLFILGSLLIFSVLYPLQGVVSMAPAYLGFLMIMVAYFFTVEAIRELEGKEHWLSSKLMEKTDYGEESEE